MWWMMELLCRCPAVGKRQSRDDAGGDKISRGQLYLLGRIEGAASTADTSGTFRYLRILVWLG